MIAHLFLINKELLLFWFFCAFILSLSVTSLLKNHFISLCHFVAEKDSIRQLSTVKAADSNIKKPFDRYIRVRGK